MVYCAGKPIESVVYWLNRLHRNSTTQTYN